MCEPSVCQAVSREGTAELAQVGSKALGTRWPLWSWWVVQKTCPQPSVDQVTLITLNFLLDLSNG